LKSRWTRPASWAAARPRPASIRRASTVAAGRRSREPGAQVDARHVLHGDEHLVVGDADLEDGDDVG
jgi:hypothetical protein